jgi:hypothetical protein
LAIDGVNAYWSEDVIFTNGNRTDQMRQVPLAGGASTVFVYGQVGGPIVADGTNVYWGSANGSGQVMMAPPGGRTLTTLASGVGSGGIAVDATSVYWTDYTNGDVWKLTPKIGTGSVESPFVPVTPVPDAGTLTCGTIPCLPCTSNLVLCCAKTQDLCLCIQSGQEGTLCR